MIGRLLSVAAMMFWVGIGVAHAAGNAAAGKAKAAVCAGCHGAEGQGVGTNPPLKGLSEAQIVQNLEDFKSGKRSNAVMKGISAGLTGQDMANLAAYFASLK